MVEITATSLHWLSDTEPESDLCAHGRVQLTVLGDRICTEGEFCVSAAALYLLRTLESDHTQSHPVAEHLLPCCGHAMHAAPGDRDVTIIGCPNGVNWFVEHNEDATVTLSLAGASTYTIPDEQWVSAVCAFSDVVSRFYDDSASKKPFDSYAAIGYTTFRREWSRRRRFAAAKWDVR